MISVLKKHRLPIGLVLINIIIKSIYLTDQSVSHDEPFSLYHAQFDFWTLIDFLKKYNNPPLYEIILHYWIKVFGISELAIRALPMLFSSLSVLFIYKIGKSFFDIRVGLAASLLFTFSSFQIWYAHDCRVYSLFLLLTVMSMYLFFKLIKDQRLSKFDFISLLLVNSLILYAHYFGIFIWLVESVIILLFYFKIKPVLIPFLKLGGISFLLFIPQLVIMFERFFESAKIGTWVKAPNGIESLYNLIWIFTNEPIVAVTSIGLLVFGVFNFFISKSKQNPFIKYCTIWFFVPFLLIYAVSFKIPMFLDRYLIFITPALYILLVVAVGSLFRKKVFQNTATLILVALFLFSFKINPSKKREVRQTVDFIKERKDSKTMVIACSREFITNFSYYYNPYFFTQLNQIQEYGVLENHLAKDNIFFVDFIDSTLWNKINNFDRILYLDAAADFAAPQNFINRDLSAVFHLKSKTHFDEIFDVYEFDRLKK